MKSPIWFTPLSALPMLVLCSALFSQAQQPGGKIYEPIPAEFKIPGDKADQATLQHWVDSMNVKALRRHGWGLFAGLTYPSHRHRADADDVLPIWETWYSKEETFMPPSAAQPKQLSFKFPPAELAQTFHKSPEPIVSVAARILFNQDAHDHIQGNCLYLRSKLMCLRNYPDGKSPAPEVPDFPPGSVTLKTSWMHVSQSKCTPIPVWDGEPGSPPGLDNSPSAWIRKVWVYAPGVSPDSCPKGTKGVPLKAFYHLKILSQCEVKTWQSSENVQVDPASGQIEVNDYVVLVGFHAATRELPNWVWTTFWWHDRPDEGPYGSDRPPRVRGVWRHYLMDVAYDMDRPREHDSSPRIAFNPYLEGGIPGGVHSNCMTCHRRATFPNQSGVVTLDSDSADPVDETQIVVRGSVAATATYLPDFDERLWLHFVWSLAEATGPPPGPLPPACACTNQPHD